MAKVLVLLFLLLSAFACVAGCLYLTKLISAGDIQIAEGQRTIEEGYSTIKEGEADLDEGRERLSEGKEDYSQAEDNLFLVIVDRLLRGGRGFREGRERIAEGGRQISEGVREIDAGRMQMEAGELEMIHGREQLRLSRDMRVASAVGAGVFATLTLVLGICWRRRLIRIFRHKGA